MGKARWAAAAVLVGAWFCGKTALNGREAGRERAGTDRAAILKLLNDQQQAWNRGDLETFLQGYWHSPQLTFAGSNGIARGWEGVQARYKNSYPDRAAMGKLDFSQIEFPLLESNAALVLGHWHLTREKGDVGGVFSLVLRRLPEGWRIIHDHTSVVPEAK